MKTEYSVTELTKQIKSILSSSFSDSVIIKGEISNYKRYASGHSYFVIKDETSQIKAVMFSSYHKDGVKLVDGLKIRATGKITVYERDGVYQINVTAIEDVGIGELFKKYELLKKKLSDEGLFSPDKKKDIPPFPNKIGVVISKDGAAIRDILSTLKRRYIYPEILVFPCLNQGKEASISIINAVNKAVAHQVDVIIIARGGGSFEDLFCYNDEELIRLIAKIDIPTISAIGHETDFTLLDFVASIRAATPTASAEIVSQYGEKLLDYLFGYKMDITQKTISKINLMKEKIEKYSKSKSLNNIHSIVENKKQLLDNTILKINTSFLKGISEKKHKIEILKSRINSFDNDKIMKRGYSYVTSDQKMIKSFKEATNNMTINFYDGKINVIKEE